MVEIRTEGIRTEGVAAGGSAPVRPQPLGAFALPAGFMLIPGGADTEPARRALLAGRLPGQWPPALHAHRLALAGELDDALAALEGTDPVVRYNRFVLDPGVEEPAALRRELGPDLAVLVDLVCFALGHRADPPAVGASDGELAALVLAAQATHAVSAGDPAGAEELLTGAVEHALGVSEPLAGVLLGAAASVRQQARGTGPGVTDMLQRALRLLEGTDLQLAQAELHLALAQAWHEMAGERRDLLTAAVRHYHCALRLLTREQAPDLYATAHANLAAAYLTMPMVQAGDQLRVGVAVQSLRAALTVYTPETHPQHWASAQLNLANALVYAPSKHQRDNLVEAVELYETVLNARDRQTDPLGRGRVLTNQGNALAHLGAFDQAKAKLAEARFLFEEFQDTEGVLTVRDILDEIARHSALAKAEK